MKGRLLLLVNPVSGKNQGKRRLFDIVDILTKGGFSVTVEPTRSRQHTIDLIKERAKDFDIAAAVGGDGTLNNAMNGIIACGVELPLGYIPLGSTNDFAVSVGIPAKLKDACEHIVNAEPTPTDVGKFGDEYFSYIACTGIFADASYSTPQQMKNTLGYGAYILRGAGSLLENHRSRCVVELENETISDEFIFMSVSNALRAGGIFKLSKDQVSFDDGNFELIMVPSPKNIKDGAQLANAAITNDLSAHTIIHRSVKSAKFHFEDMQGWSLDGENGGKHKEASIEVMEKALLLIR